MGGQTDSINLALEFICGMSLVILIVLLLLYTREARGSRAFRSEMKTKLAKLNETNELLLKSIVSLKRNQTQATQTQTNHTTQPAQPQANHAAQPSPQTMKPIDSPRRYAPQTPQPPSRIPSFEAQRVLSAVNELIKSGGAYNDAYNIEETVRLSNPALQLQRVSPRGNVDAWSSLISFASGGDAYFALIDGDKAWLYPNNDRFRGSHDPAPIFENGYADGQIGEVLRPGSLIRMSDGSWQLTGKGLVLMK